MGTVVVVAWTVVEIVVGIVVGTIVVVAGTVVEIVVGTIVVAAVVVDTIVVGAVVGAVVGCTLVVDAPGFGLGSPTFQLRLETGKLTNPADVTVKLPRNEYVVPVTV